MGDVPSETTRVLAHVAGFHAAVTAAHDVGLPAAGWGLDQAFNYAEQFLSLRERLRQVEPVLFGDLPTSAYGGSIASRNTLLRQLIFDSHSVLVTGNRLGLCDAPPAISLQQRQSTAKRFVKEHNFLVQVVAAVIAAGIVYVLRWNK